MAELSLKKKLLFAGTASLVAAAAVLLAGECYVRLFSRHGHMDWESYRARNLQYEAGLFSRYNIVRREQNLKTGSGKLYHINSKGYRGHDFEAVKPPGKIRIMIYGGSTAFDSEETQGKDWPSLLENFLHDKGYPNAEVINAGVPGSASFDALGRFFGEGHLFAPDYVIFYGIWNDLKYFNTSIPVLRFHVPLPEDDPISTPRNRLDKFLGNHSQLYFRLRIRYGYWKYRVGPEGMMPRVMEKSSEISPLALKQYKLTLLMFVDLAQNIGAVPMLVTEATLINPRNTEEQKKRILDYTALTHQGLCLGYQKCREVTREVAAAKQVPLIDAGAVMDGIDELFADHVHLSEKGSQMLAGMVGAELIKLIESKKSAPPRSSNP